MEKGNLLFETPSNDSYNLAFAVALSILGILPWIVITVAIVTNFHNINFTCNMQYFFVFGFFLLFSIMAVIKGDDALNPYFKVYSNGVTKPLRSFQLIFKSEGRFVTFSEIRAFETNPSGSKMESIIYYEPKKRVYFEHNKNVIKQLIRLLQSHGINEIPKNCSNCRKYIWGYYFCPYCKNNRW
jgi:hypothetical protein